MTIVGGGYLGLWTAIRIKERAPSLKIAVVERDLCGAGGSGRNGGFVTSCWLNIYRCTSYAVPLKLPGLRKAQRQRYLKSVLLPGNGIDAEFRGDGWLYTETSGAQIGCRNVPINELAKHNIRPFEVLDNAAVERLGGTET
ncbi:FAD-dependent oxidoreductase [Bradyrhizobium sp. Arg68]|nr:FAD-dependent oxidoreductase [Bradyrhizobium ivorense]